MRFAILDDQSSPQIAVQLFNTIAAKRPPMVIGPSLVGACNAIAPLIPSGPVVYCLSAGMHPAAGSYMFTYGITTIDSMRLAVVFLKARGLRRIAAIFPTDASGQDGERALDLALAARENSGVALVESEHFNTGDVSVSAQVARIKAASPQALIAWGTGAPLGAILHATSDAGLNVPMFVSASNLNYKEMQQYADILPREMLIVTVPGVVPDAATPGPLKTAALAFYTAVKASGAKPDGNMVIGWDSGLLSVTVLRELGLGANAEQVRSHLTNVHGWYGAAGQYDFRDGSQRGVTISTAVVVRYDLASRTFVPVSRIGGKVEQAGTSRPEREYAK